MPSSRLLAATALTTLTLLISGCGSSTASSSATTTPTATGNPSSQASPSTTPPSGTAGGGGTAKSITAAATAELAKDLGVTPAALTAALAKARANGPGVNLVRALSTELEVSQDKVAAGLKALGPNGP